MDATPSLDDAVRRAFHPCEGPPRIGVELELHLQSKPPGGIPDLAGELVERGRPSLEPGGQLELSLPPQPSVAALVREVDWCLETLSATTDFALTGVDPWRALDDVPLVLETPRYLSMQQLFDRDGDAGRRMMRLTASLQVCVDLLPGRAGHEQWLVANLAGPSLVAAHPGHLARTRIWQDIDAARTGYDGRHLGVHDPVGSYAAFAAAASRLPLPEAADDAYHLSTLFPPVRPRGGYLELRYLDSQRPTHELLGTIWALMYDAGLRRDALALLLPTLPTFGDQWEAADPTALLALVAGRREEVAA
ncbi:glutamate--cysteine ligase [Pedococcus dokdonensis]|uniref:glutamate--cysteine ligase n=1 Tax=Pedococcus dokdonensis TaxID=443156 RepID=A0A1H0TYA0_9MICO|nr:glutamate-cysteine ligase family protein [Pedococcus dokdonensis]SDP58861.1 glutamate--cysteine ligase [Pedococcus dokdonensis]